MNSSSSIGLVRVLIVAAAAFAGSRGYRATPPPVPPQPAPPAPAPPADPMTAKFQAAFATDAGTAEVKISALRDLAELYRQAAGLAADPTIATASALLDRVRSASQSLVKPGLLAGTRAAIAAEIAAVFPTDGPLGDDVRATAASLFKRIAAALASVQPQSSFSEDR